MRMRVLTELGLPEILPYVRTLVQRPPSTTLRPVLPCVYPNWANSPRSGSSGLVAHGSTPERFRVHVVDALQRVPQLPAGRRLLFVKSWNEWAEGNHLEPDLRFGRRYLEVLRDTVQSAPASTRESIDGCAIADRDGLVLPSER